MNILMMTNTYKPIVGGLERSIETFTEEYRKRGHRVVIVAPECQGAPEEPDVVRIPALQHFNGSDFSVQLPIPGTLSDALGDFRPDIIHSHHPFLVGDTALRLAYKLEVPLVFTHHTLYEHNTHYVSDSEALKRFVVQLSAGYANMADHVFSPSESLARLLRERGVKTPVTVVPTGIDLAHFAKGKRAAFRRRHSIPSQAFLAGHIGRLATEKNLEFLSRAVALFLSAKGGSASGGKRERAVHFLLGGKGTLEEPLKAFFHQQGLAERVHFTGILLGQELVDAYHAIDAFVFASQSETQGVVLNEAMVCGAPVVAVDACGVRDIVSDGENGFLLASENETEFAAALLQVERLSPERRRAMREAAKRTAARFSKERCAELALSVYSAILSLGSLRGETDGDRWRSAMRLIEAEWKLIKNLTKATKEAVTERGLS